MIILLELNLVVILKITEELGYKTYPKFWNTELSNEIKESFENGFDSISHQIVFVTFKI